jgi:hypothetical protein
MAYITVSKTKALNAIINKLDIIEDNWAKELESRKVYWEAQQKIYNETPKWRKFLQNLWSSKSWILDVDKTKKITYAPYWDGFDTERARYILVGDDLRQLRRAVERSDSEFIMLTEKEIGLIGYGVW